MAVAIAANNKAVGVFLKRPARTALFQAFGLMKMDAIRGMSPVPYVREFCIGRVTLDIAA